MKTKEKVFPKEKCLTALPVTREEFLSFGLPESAIDSGEFRGELKSFGPWQIPISFIGLAESSIYTPEDKRMYTAELDQKVVYGIRTMTDCRPDGYCLAGRVSIKRKKYRAFTSSQLFDVDGKLVNVATIVVCK